ncbi:FKBP-type peptidyl-prolyl cis-trans isomerase [Bernardetia sp.]|uniref:FKBP-type peptidyl-prolyl cis-trans isomerase n=1 Tax=Bernardetia sp. TaxID=1937974 RepID=UPI0025BEEFDD|nr:FKBP-type peptidyl-prolyl cis-trans isomerase [Bernardetia sp.]
MFLYRFILLLSVFCISLSANAQNKKNKGEKELKGIRYQLHTKKKERKKALAVTDYSIIELNMKIFNNTDSLLRSTEDEDFPLVIDLRDSMTRKLPIVEILMQDGRIGDSLSLFVHSDSVFQNGQIRPIFIPEGSFLRHEIKLIKNYEAEEYATMLDKMQQEYMEKMQKEREQQLKEQQMAEKNRVKTQTDFLENTYFKQKQITNFTKTESGLYYVVEKQGTAIERGERVKVHYEGTLTDGTKFDSSFDRGEPIEFPIGIGQVIKGWDEGIPLIGKGGKGYLYIPSHLGYGERGAGGAIKPNSILVFKVEILEN